MQLLCSGNIYFWLMIESIGAKAPTVAYKSFSPAGDLVACLPGMRQIYRETGKKAHIFCRLNFLGHYYDGAIHSTEDENGTPVCMSQKHWDMLVPLLEAQDYVHKAEVWEGQPAEIDLDILRSHNCTPMPNGHLYWWQPLIHPQMATDFSERYIGATGAFSVKIVPREHTTPVVYSGNYVNVLRDRVIINRTERYINQFITYYFLKDYADKLVFSGTRKEYERFCTEWKLDIPYLEVNDYLELAQAIARCKFYLGNQSLGAHIANGLGKKRLLEICPNVANTWPTTKHGYPFMHNVSVEYYFRKFMSE